MALTRIRTVSYISPGPNGEASATLTHGGSIPADTTIVVFVACAFKPNQGTGQPGMPSGPGSTAGISWHNFGYDDSVDGLLPFPSSSTLQLIVYYAYVPSAIASDTTTFLTAGGPEGPMGYVAVYYQGNVAVNEFATPAGGSVTPASTGAFTIGSGLADDGFLIAVFSGNSGLPSGTPALATAQLATAGQTTLTLGGVAPNQSLSYSVWEAASGPYTGAIAAQSSGVSSGQWVARIIALGSHSVSTAYTASLTESVSGPTDSVVTHAGGHVALAEPGGMPLSESISGGVVVPFKPMPLADVRIVWADGQTDMIIAEDDVASDAGLRTAITLSLFTDRRANDDDALPAAGGDRRGWWGDQFAAVEGDKIGSRLWLLDRSARREDTVQRATEYAREALAWMLEDRVAAAVNVDVESVGDQITYSVGIVRPQGDAVTFKFAHVWAAEVGA